MQQAENIWIKAIQHKQFQETINNLKNNKPYAKNLQHLNPLLKNGLLRVGSRLEYATYLTIKQPQYFLPKINIGGSFNRSLPL